jgi:hypothetical protein
MDKGTVADMADTVGTVEKVRTTGTGEMADTAVKT